MEVFLDDFLEAKMAELHIPGAAVVVVQKGNLFLAKGYGYLWWSARIGDHHVNYAAGHGGQLIVLLDEPDMVIVATADPFYGQSGGEAWRSEKAVFDPVSKFISSLPSE